MLQEEWSISLPSETTNVDSLLVTDDSILAGCSDNNIHLFDRETNKSKGLLVGHEDYVNCLRNREVSSNLLYSGSEDGSVRVWDLRTQQSTAVYLPFKNVDLDRPEHGKWIGALDVSPNGEWIVCGGGPCLSLWHLRSKSFINKYDNDATINVVDFIKDDSSHFLSAGTSKAVLFWCTTDTLCESRVETSIENVYSVAHHKYSDLDYDLYCLAGDSFRIDLCKDANYVDCQLSVH